MWALTVNATEDRIVTGAGDSTVIVWKVTNFEAEFLNTCIRPDLFLFVGLR